MRELDVLLTNYLDSQFQGAPAEEQAAFRALLESQDTVIQAYCLGMESPPDATTRALIGRLTTGGHHER